MIMLFREESVLCCDCKQHFKGRFDLVRFCPYCGKEAARIIYEMPKKRKSLKSYRIPATKKWLVDVRFEKAAGWFSLYETTGKTAKEALSILNEVRRNFNVTTEFDMWAQKHVGKKEFVKFRVRLGDPLPNDSELALILIDEQIKESNRWMSVKLSDVRPSFLQPSSIR